MSHIFNEVINSVNINWSLILQLIHEGSINFRLRKQKRCDMHIFNYTDIQFFLNIVSLCMTHLPGLFFMLFTDIFSEYFYHPQLKINT
jgi:hypothetical protein